MRFVTLTDVKYSHCVGTQEQRLRNKNRKICAIGKKALYLQLLS